MCFFRRKKKQPQPIEEPKVILTTPPEKPKTPEPVASEPKKPEPTLSEPKKPEPATVEPMKQKPVAQAKSTPVKPEESAAAVPTNDSKYTGKYEVFPEAGLFKYRLKASNGEILIVSQGYTTKAGAISGIDTLKRNVIGGIQEIYTDKSDFSQFRIMTSTGARLVAAGEFYETEKKAQSAFESVKRFANTDKIVELNELPKKEMREEVVVLKKLDENANGKYEVYSEGKLWFFLLKASNGEVLMESQGYSSKSGALSGLDNVKKALIAGNFRVSRDKQDRYMFTLYATNNQALVTGHTYPSKDNCLAAVDSVRRFGLQAKIVEL